MIEVCLVNLKTRQKFTKEFTSPFLARKFLNKVKYSKKLAVVSVFGI